MHSTRLGGRVRGGVFQTSFVFFSLKPNWGSYLPNYLKEKTFAVFFNVDLPKNCCGSPFIKKKKKSATRELIGHILPSASRLPPLPALIAGLPFCGFGVHHSLNMVPVPLIGSVKAVVHKMSAFGVNSKV